MVAELSWHLSRFAGQAGDALVFTSSTGSPLRHGDFRHRDWLTAIDQISLTGIRFHDSGMPVTR